MNVLVVATSSPYGSDGTANALRLAAALVLRGEWVDIFLMGDGVYAARRGQDPGTLAASVELQVNEVVEKGARLTLCGTCCRSRGIQAADVVDGARLGTIHDLAALSVSADRVISL